MILEQLEKIIVDHKKLRRDSKDDRDEYQYLSGYVDGLLLAESIIKQQTKTDR